MQIEKKKKRNEEKPEKYGITNLCSNIVYL